MMNDSSGSGEPEMEENRNRLSLSPSPSRESNASNLEDDLDLSSPNSSLVKSSSHKDGGSHSSKQGPSPKSSRENTPEKRSSEREKSSDREKTPDEGSDKDKRLSESPDDTKPSTSTASTSKNAPSASPSASTSGASEKKRKSTFTEEELKQAIKRHKKQDEERMKMQVLVSNFSEEQLNRYEMYRRATFPRAAIKRLMQNITATTVSQNVVIAMSGISKVFVGEVLETALDVSEKWGDSGPLQPKHLREAVRILNSKGMMPSTKSKKCLF